MYRQDPGQGYIRESKISDTHPHGGKSGSEDTGEGQDSGRGRRGASFPGNPYLEAHPPPQHHPALRNYRNPEAALPHHGVHGGRGAF